MIELQTPNKSVIRFIKARFPLHRTPKAILRRTRTGKRRIPLPSVPRGSWAPKDRKDQWQTGDPSVGRSPDSKDHPRTLRNRSVPRAGSSPEHPGSADPRPERTRS